MSSLDDHPLRYALANELHARPFPSIEGAARAVYLAIKQPTDAVARDRNMDRAHLCALLDRYGVAHPAPGATHYFGQIGKHRLKWEQHTEFVTYTVFLDGLSTRAFDPVDWDVLPADWLADAPGACMTSAMVRIEACAPDEDISPKIEDWFVGESLAISHVIDGAAVIAGDFRIDSAGHMRFSVFTRPGVGARRVGRIVQRLTEIETYKAMSMLGLTRVRELSAQMGDMDQRLSGLVGAMTQTDARAEETLNGLLSISAELENLIAKTQFRFGATGAYEALVKQRIVALREERFNGRQTFLEFMQRRFDPAMRTVKSTEGRLQSMALRAARAGDLLRTRVDVERSAQNQALLASMDRRADLQLRLQKTVEGFSVAAISYYAVNLSSYLAIPFAEKIGLGKGATLAVLTPLVLVLVWGAVQRIKRRMD